MADTDDKKQLNVLLTYEAHGMILQLHKAEEKKVRAVGDSLSLSSYVERLVRAEAERQGIKPKKK